MTLRCDVFNKTNKKINSIKGEMIFFSTLNSNNEGVVIETHLALASHNNNEQLKANRVNHLLVHTFKGLASLMCGQTQLPDEQIDKLKEVINYLDSTFPNETESMYKDHLN